MDQLDEALSNQHSAVDDQAAIQTVSVYTRHKRSCPKRDRPDWARCNCAKWLYVYRNGKSKQISAKTRSWERAEQKARELRDSFDPVTILQKRLQAKTDGETSEVEVDTAVEQFLAEVARLNRAEATCAKYKLTLGRLSKWCATQEKAILFLSELDVATVRRWIHSWKGAPTTLHNQHQRAIAFFNFCMEQGWLKENPAKKIKKVPRQQEATLPFTREQYDALIEATYHYDGRGKRWNGETTNSRRTRTYLNMLRWSGLRAGDGACMAKTSLRDDDSLVLNQEKVKGKNSAPVCVLLPHEVAQELRSVPPSSVTHPDYFFWSCRSKRKSEVSNWEKTFAKVLDKAVELAPKLFLDTNGDRKPAHLHMLRDTFAVEYLLAGMGLEEVSRLLGHSSVRVTQEHYAPWVLERQQRLAANQRAAWESMGLHQASHTPQRSPKITRVHQHHRNLTQRFTPRRKQVRVRG